MESENELLAMIDAISALEREHGLVNRFNLFHAVGITRQEIRHSRFLAFLLNPAETHGLGDRFLRSILMAVVSAHPNPPVSRLKAAIADCSDALVFCERDHLDITVQIPELRVMFVIENKVGATERPDQLKDYRRRVESRYADHIFLGAFLTPDGYGGDDDEWSCLSYRTVADELRVLTAETTVPPVVSMTIAHYVELIEREVVVSKELMDACRTIYAKHRLAMDLIVEHGRVPVLAEAFDTLSETVPGLEAHTSRSTDLYFTASSWRALPGFQLADTNRWGTTCPVHFWFRVKESKLYLRLEAGPVKDGARFDRAKFVKELRTGLCEKDRLGTREVYTRIRTVSTALTDDLDAEEMTRAMTTLWKTMGGQQTIDIVVSAARDCIRPDDAVAGLPGQP